MLIPLGFSYLFFEAPHTVCYAFAALAVLLLIVGRGFRSRRLLVSSALALALSVGAYAVSTAVVTDRERIIALTHRAVKLATVKPFDASALGKLMDPQVLLTGPDGTTWLSSDQIFAELDRVDRFDRIHQAIVTDIKVKIGKPSSTWSQLDLRTVVDTDLGPQVVKTRWKLQWSQHEVNEWKIMKAQWLVHPDPNGIQPSAGIWH